MTPMSFTIQRPGTTLLIVLLITSAAGLFAARVSFESAIEVWFLQSDPALVAYDEFTEQFAADELVVLAIRGEVFNEETYALLARLAEQLAKVPYVHRVRTLLDFELDPVIPFGEDLALRNETGGQTVQADWSYRKAEAASNRLITPILVAEDGQTAAVVVEVERSGNTVAGKQTLVTALDEIIALEADRTGRDIYLTGTPVLDQRALALNDRDLTRIYPLIVPLVLLFCWLAFGSLQVALIPLLVVAGAATWTFGFMGLVGLKTTLLSSAMVPLFLAIGVADSVHVLADYQHRRISGETPRPAVGSTMTQLWQPCLFTSVTTAAGLSALLVSDLRPVREFGLSASVGVLAAFVLTMTLVPAILSLLGGRLPASRPWATTWMAQLVRQFVNPPRPIRRFVVVGGIVIGLLSLASAIRIEVGVNPMSWFRSADPFRQATRLVDTQLGGATAVEFLVTGPAHGFASPATLAKLDGFERWVESTTIVSRCTSVVELLKEATRTLSEGVDRRARLPGMAAVTRPLLNALAARGELERWLSEDRSVGRISCRLPLGRSADLGAELARLQAEIERRFGGTDLMVTPTGYGVLMVQMEHLLVRSQLLSVSIAFLAVLLMLALLIRSLALGLVAMLPNLLPVAVGLGLMPVLGISLNPGTVMVAAVALGIVVDDTAHLLVAMRRHLDFGQTVSEALASAITDVGSPVILTSLILMASMSMLMLGSFAPGIDFGAIAAIIALVALLADLWLLPQLLTRVPVARWLRVPARDRNNITNDASRGVQS